MHAFVRQSSACLWLSRFDWTPGRACGWLLAIWLAARVASFNLNPLLWRAPGCGLLVTLVCLSHCAFRVINLRGCVLCQNTRASPGLPCAASFRGGGGRKALEGVHEPAGHMRAIGVGLMRLNCVWVACRVTLRALLIWGKHARGAFSTRNATCGWLAGGTLAVWQVDGNVT